MIVTITTSGGIGGFGLGRSVQVETDSLSPELRAEACERFDPEVLEELSEEAPQGADRITYRIAVEREGEERMSFDIPESALPAETLDLIDDLLAEGK
jgi:hypothetical protein